MVATASGLVPGLQRGQFVMVPQQFGPPLFPQGQPAPPNRPPPPDINILNRAAYHLQKYLKDNGLQYISLSDLPKLYEVYPDTEGIVTSATIHDFVRKFTDKFRFNGARDAIWLKGPELPTPEASSSLPDVDETEYRNVAAKLTGFLKRFDGRVSIGILSNFYLENPDAKKMIGKGQNRLRLFCERFPNTFYVETVGKATFIGLVDPNEKESPEVPGQSNFADQITNIASKHDRPPGGQSVIFKVEIIEHDTNGRDLSRVEDVSLQPKYDPRSISDVISPDSLKHAIFGDRWHACDMRVKHSGRSIDLTPDLRCEVSSVDTILLKCTIPRIAPEPAHSSPPPGGQNVIFKVEIIEFDTNERDLSRIEDVSLQPKYDPSSNMDVISPDSMKRAIFGDRWHACDMRVKHSGRSIDLTPDLRCEVSSVDTILLKCTIPRIAPQTAYSSTPASPNLPPGDAPVDFTVVYSKAGEKGELITTKHEVSLFTCTAKELKKKVVGAKLAKEHYLFLGGEEINDNEDITAAGIEGSEFRLRSIGLQKINVKIISKGEQNDDHVWIEFDATILDLKKVLKRKFKIPTSNQRMIFMRVLEDHEVLSEIGFDPDVAEDMIRVIETPGASKSSAASSPSNRKVPIAPRTGESQSDEASLPQGASVDSWAGFPEEMEVRSNPVEEQPFNQPKENEWTVVENKNQGSSRKQAAEALVRFVKKKGGQVQVGGGTVMQEFYNGNPEWRGIIQGATAAERKAGGGLKRFVLDFPKLLAYHNVNADGNNYISLAGKDVDIPVQEESSVIGGLDKYQKVADKLYLYISRQVNQMINTGAMSTFYDQNPKLKGIIGTEKGALKNFVDYYPTFFQYIKNDNGAFIMITPGSQPNAQPSSSSAKPAKGSKGKERVAQALARFIVGRGFKNNEMDLGMMHHFYQENSWAKDIVGHGKGSLPDFFKLFPSVFNHMKKGNAQVLKLKAINYEAAIRSDVSNWQGGSGPAKPVRSKKAEAAAKKLMYFIAQNTETGNYLRIDFIQQFYEAHYECKGVIQTSHPGNGCKEFIKSFPEYFSLQRRPGSDQMYIFLTATPPASPPPEINDAASDSGFWSTPQQETTPESMYNHADHLFVAEQLGEYMKVLPGRTLTMGELQDGFFKDNPSAQDIVESCGVERFCRKFKQKFAVVGNTIRYVAKEFSPDEELAVAKKFRDWIRSNGGTVSFNKINDFYVIHPECKELITAKKTNRFAEGFPQYFEIIPGNDHPINPTPIISLVKREVSTISPEEAAKELHRFLMQNGGEMQIMKVMMAFYNHDSAAQRHIKSYGSVEQFVEIFPNLFEVDRISKVIGVKRDEPVRSAAPVLSEAEEDAKYLAENLNFYVDRAGGELPMEDVTNDYLNRHAPWMATIESCGGIAEFLKKFPDLFAPLTFNAQDQLVIRTASFTPQPPPPAMVPPPMPQSSASASRPPPAMVPPPMPQSSASAARPKKPKQPASQSELSDSGYAASKILKKFLISEGGRMPLTSLKSNFQAYDPDTFEKILTQYGGFKKLTARFPETFEQIGSGILMEIEAKRFHVPPQPATGSMTPQQMARILHRFIMDKGGWVRSNVLQQDFQEVERGIYMYIEQEVGWGRFLDLFPRMFDVEGRATNVDDGFKVIAKPQSNSPPTFQSQPPAPSPPFPQPPPNLTPKEARYVIRDILNAKYGGEAFAESFYPELYKKNRDVALYIHANFDSLQSFCENFKKKFLVTRVPGKSYEDRIKVIGTREVKQTQPPAEASTPARVPPAMPPPPPGNSNFRPRSPPPSYAPPEPEYKDPMDEFAFLND